MSDSLISGDQSALSAPKLDIAGMRIAAQTLVAGQPPAAPAPPPASPPAPPQPTAVGVPAYDFPPATPASAPVAVAPVTDAPLDPSQVQDLPDHQYFKFTVDGRPTVMTGAEAKRMMISGKSYTQGMQEVRAQERAFTEALGVPATAENLAVVRQTLEQAVAMEQLLTDPTKLRQYFAEVLKQPIAPVPGAPAVPTTPSPGSDRLLTMAEAEQVVAAKLDQLQQSLLERVDGAVNGSMTQIEVARDAARLKAGMSSQIAEAVTQYPILQMVPDLEGVVKRTVKSLGPRTEQELAHAVTNVLRGMVEQASPYLASPAAAGRAAAQAVRVEPPSGSTPPVQRQSLVGADGKFDFGRLRQVAHSYPTR